MGEKIKRNSQNPDLYACLPTYLNFEPGGGNKRYFELLTQLVGPWPTARFLLFH
jgi:hypothetical protein